MSPFVGGRYMDPDEYADARADARREEYEDRVEASGWTCGDCGEMWDPAWVPATRTDPSYPRQDSCPSCGGDPITDRLGPVVGRINPER